MSQYIGSIKEALSQLLNAVLGGYPDEMLSARAHRVNAWYETPINAVLGSRHCHEMYEYEWTRKSQHPHYSGDGPQRAAR